MLEIEARREKGVRGKGNCERGMGKGGCVAYVLLMGICNVGIRCMLLIKRE